ncbi:beta-lactamase-like protein [Flammula alnicola]|nr:beta-lactamase-like protein [Flammula alnicola]
MSVTFLGTSSGGGPSESRNCSSLVCDMLADQSLWMVDCAEGTARQFTLQPQYTKPHLRIMKLTKIFITHMHADHIMGVVPLLRNILFAPPAGNSAHISSAQASARTIELYGPAGLRLFVRQIMKMTLTRTSDRYVVHELLASEDSVTPCDPPTSNMSSPLNISEPNILHHNEIAGLDIRASPDGLWRAITQGNGKLSEIVVDAGPILHRGYTFTEVRYPSRKLVILGDTFDPAPMIPLCINPSPSLLIHEATDSHISQHADPSGKLSRRSANDVLEKALQRGHSVPEMAGAFAKLVNARDLVLNHIGGRFPAPRNPKDYARHKIIQDIEEKAIRHGVQENMLPQHGISFASM